MTSERSDRPATMTGVSRSQTTSIKRPPAPAADEGRSRLGDFTRPIPVEKRISRRPKVALFAGLFVLAVIGVLGRGDLRAADPDVARPGRRPRPSARPSSTNSRRSTSNSPPRSTGCRPTTASARRHAKRSASSRPARSDRRSCRCPPLPTDLPDGWPYNVVTSIIEARRAGPAPHRRRLGCHDAVASDRR